MHNDEEIYANKGLCVMKLDERINYISSCKWVTKIIPNAPYVTDSKYLDFYNIHYAVHGNDITTDKNGEDCYKKVRKQKRFLELERTKNISTTILINRILTRGKSHHFLSFDDFDGDFHLHPLFKNNMNFFKTFASDKTGVNLGHAVFFYSKDKIFNPLFKKKLDNKKIFYIDGSFDLFNYQHIEILKKIKSDAEREDALFFVGVHNDIEVNNSTGMDFPIMNLLERSLCILQCKYIDDIVINLPFYPDFKFLSQFPGTLERYYCLDSEPQEINRLKRIKDHVKLIEIKTDNSSGFNYQFIIDRILNNIDLYKQRQKKKYESQIDH